MRKLYEKNELMMEELLKKRHLAPIYGERTPLASELEDYLVIEHVPSVLFCNDSNKRKFR